jgi:CxxC motif-containing protein (DUF1111 family)
MTRNTKPMSFLYQFNRTVLLPLLLSGAAFAQQTPSQTNQSHVADPGPRQGLAGAGLPFQTLSSADLAAFNAGKFTFLEVDAVPNGLGPRFNADSCAACHAQPAVGGSSPAVNPQISAATRNGANNQIPAFITPNGPTRVARLRHNTDGSLNGGVLALFTISGRGDAPGCNAAQPNFAELAEANNLTFRIPTPAFGSGLIEAIPDAALLANLAGNSSASTSVTASAKSGAGIQGRFNTNGNDGSITRFGWKAQNKSLVIFGGEAYNVEQGVTNEVFPNERENIPGCMFNKTPEDSTNTGAATATGSWSDIIQFGNFMRNLAPPQPATPTSSTTNGQQLFSQIGCALCHTPSLSTGPSTRPQLSNQNVPLYSDLAIHHMGTELDDGISQGIAGTDEFRTAPLWGLGQRIFFLHDGRTQNLLEAIAAHASQNSEASRIVNNFNSLQNSQKQDLINFLRSL